MRGEGRGKGPRFNTRAPFLWCGVSRTAPYQEAPAGATRRNDRSSKIAPTATTGTRKGPTEGPQSLATSQAWCDLRDKPQRQTAEATRRSVAATAPKEADAQGRPSSRSDQPAETPQRKCSDAATRQHSAQTDKPKEDCSKARPAATAGSSDQMPRSWTGR